MSLSDITNTIHEEAEARRQTILATAENKISALKEAEKSAQAAQLTAYTAETELIEQQNIETITGTAGREQKEIVDSVKRELVDEVFTRALDRLKTFSDADYKSVIIGYLKQVSADIGTCDVYTSPKHVAVTKSALSEAKISGTVHEDKEITHGGFRIVGETFEYNFTFEKMIQEQKQVLEIDVAKTLFRGQE